MQALLYMCVCVQEESSSPGLEYNLKNAKGIASFYARIAVTAVEMRLQADLRFLLPCQSVISGWIPLPHQSPAAWAKSTPVTGSARSRTRAEVSPGVRTLLPSSELVPGRKLVFWVFLQLAFWFGFVVKRHKRTDVKFFFRAFSDAERKRVC